MNALENIKAKFGDQVEIFHKSKARAYVTARPEVAREVVKYLFVDLKVRFSIASGLDARDGVEILYHMACDQEGLMVTVKTLVAKPALSQPTYTDFMPAVNWIEREIHELLGVDFPGHPELKPLLLTDDWPEGVYPLRKSFNINQLNNERPRNE